MQNFSIGKVINVLLLCIVVGWILSLFGINLDNFWQGMADLIRSTATHVVDILENAWPYLLTGAGVVLPIYIIMLIYRRFKRR